MIERLLFWVAIISFTFSGVFQVYRMHKTGSARDVSFWFMLLISTGVVSTSTLIWVGNNSTFLNVKAVVDLTVSLLVLGSTVYYKKKDRTKF
jgi:hypothetical protein